MERSLPSSSVSIFCQGQSIRVMWSEQKSEIPVWKKAVQELGKRGPTVISSRSCSMFLDCKEKRQNGGRCKGKKWESSFPLLIHFPTVWEPEISEAMDGCEDKKFKIAWEDSQLFSDHHNK